MYILKVDGTKVPMEGKPTLKDLQAAVGGHIELAMCEDGGAMYINEEGKLEGLEPNDAATELYRHNAYDIIVGDVVVMTAEELEAERTEE